MNVRALRLHVLLRASLLALLVLGVVIKPVLAPLCDIHALGHALRDYQHAQPSTVLERAEQQLDQHSEQSGHGLVHEGDSGSAYADNNVRIELIPVRFEAQRLFLPSPPSVPLEFDGVPFRPPIV